MCDTPNFIEELDPTDSDSLVRRGLRNIDPTTDQGRMNLLLGGPIGGIFNPAGLLGLGEEPEIPALATMPGQPDPFDIMIREAAYGLVRSEQAGSRRKSFITGPRGLEGPMANLILGGGTSLLGS